ncbi:hypothetical protein C7450_111183 [Chelatococcus asaccharovorans]|uniref:Uncharacterized protein n=1 Tax=Chelatococcus asaccharovorans TaxID=28210 RepID=A0A2V3U083_9HYPH|nr:hypothetical protein [Chelatococcus asaccharovorans]PXW54651.1 hypothetical protein C7450_111183 [Chelatococcus asaccharovorans]
MRIENLAVFTPSRLTKGGIELLASFTLNAHGIRLRDLTLARAGNGELLVWSARRNRDPEPIATFTQETRREIATLVQERITGAQRVAA